MCRVNGKPMRTIEGKVVVLGSQGVGKTSMVVRYIGKMFSHHISPTIGASFFTCKINLEDTRVKLQVWDTAGQERFRSMAPMYYRNANAALLVFDITQYFTFNSIKSWVKELQRNVEEPLILCVVGNKTDLEAQRKVSKEEAMDYANSIGGTYFESSALHDQGVEDVFLSTAMGLVTLSKDSLVSSLRVYDSVDDNSVLRTPSLDSSVPLQSASSSRNQGRNRNDSIIRPHLYSPSLEDKDSEDKLSCCHR
ncbi:RAS oncogene family member RabX1 [Lycorma delicatula]|uniref:RAS oncogene family member RabX1 n=1 Tax=Lycorma delicatula TaxID=130591 RepID=UPI003F51A272